jgi:hypothetical protein
MVGRCSGPGNWTSWANAGTEILDFGYPQNTETDTLKMYITTEGVKTERAMVCLVLVQPLCTS